MNISVTDPLGKATDRAKKMLFDPFEFNKWLLLGFCAFLAGLGKGGFQFPGINFNYSTGGSNQPGQTAQDGLQEITGYISEHLGTIILVGLAIAVIGFGFFALLKWLASRGDFMFLDGVVKNRGEVVKPWKKTAELANSFFLFRLVLNLVAGVLGLLVSVILLIIAWSDLQAGRFGDSAVLAVVLATLILFPIGLFYWVFQAILIDFVVPVMYKKNRKTTAALKVVWNGLIKKWPGTLCLFYLLKIVLWMGAGALILLITCLTCCLAGLPYVSSVVFLPITVFFRCYSLYFLEQFDAEWKLLEPLSKTPSDDEEEEEPESTAETIDPSKSTRDDEMDKPRGENDVTPGGHPPFDSSEKSDPDVPESPDADSEGETGNDSEAGLDSDQNKEDEDRPPFSSSD